MYSDRKTVEKIYGRTNVKRWADLDGDSDSTVISERIDYYLNVASTQLDGDLSNSPYETPFVSPYPDVIIYLAAVKAGLLLYNGRRVIDGTTESQVSKQEEEYEKLVDKINADVYHLDVTRLSTQPIKVVS